MKVALLKPYACFVTALLLVAFAVGLAVGALGMVPRWWKHRVAARRSRPGRDPNDTAAASIAPTHGA